MGKLVVIPITVLLVLLVPILASILRSKRRNHVSIAHVPGPPSHSYVLGRSIQYFVCTVGPTWRYTKVTWGSGSEVQLVKPILDGSVNLGTSCALKEYLGYVGA
jgi:hypothetical protein